MYQRVQCISMVYDTVTVWEVHILRGQKMAHSYSHLRFRPSHTVSEVVVDVPSRPVHVHLHSALLDASHARRTTTLLTAPHISECTLSFQSFFDVDRLILACTVFALAILALPVTHVHEVRQTCGTRGKEITRLPCRPRPES